MKNHKRIYKAVLTLLKDDVLPRPLLISGCERIVAESTPLASSELKAEIGEVINEMESGKIILLDRNGYSLATSKPVILRAERCERAILDMLKKKPMTKQAIREALESYFGTNKTASTKDDNILYTFIGQILKRLLSLGILVYDGALYSVAPEKKARLDDISDMLSLKDSFLSGLHARGGEFFEHYFMTLLGKYLRKHGKTVIENRTTGGSADGGIDGIISTVDVLGFREIIMVQTKNRLEETNETSVRSFYGAACAAQGSRGIFATTSGFHIGAKNFLEGIDNCVGVDGDKIFKMACECEYGIKKRSGKYILDRKIL